MSKSPTIAVVDGFTSSSVCSVKLGTPVWSVHLPRTVTSQVHCFADEYDVTVFTSSDLFV